MNIYGAASTGNLVDSMTQALMRFRQGGFLRLSNDWSDEFDDEPSYFNKVYY